MLSRYVIGSLLARRASNLVAIVSVGLVIGASVISLAFYRGLKENMAATGRADNLVVVQGGVLQTTKSTLSKQAVDQLKVLPQVAQQDGEALVSPEAHLEFSVSEAGLAFRGVEPIAFSVHDQVKIVDGRVFTKGAPELIIGKKLLGKYPGFNLGGSVKVGASSWTVVGVFAAAGSALESEVWGDRNLGGIELKKPTLLCAVLRVRSLDEVKPLAASIEKLRLAEGAGTAFALSEREYYETTLGNMAAVTSAVAGIITVLVLGAIVAAANTLHASLSGRMGEFAALWVVGHRRRRLVWLLLQEGFLLCAAAALVACLFAAGLGGAEVHALLGGDLEFKLPFGAAEIGAAFALAAGIGFAGTLYPGIQVLRRNLADDLG